MRRYRKNLPIFTLKSLLDLTASKIQNGDTHPGVLPTEAFINWVEQQGANGCEAIRWR